jgi:TPR repeat protein
MRTLIIIPVLLFSLLLGVPSYSADFNKGLTAAQSGDFATALKEWKPLAGQGDADAQTNLGLMYQNGWGVPQDDKEAVYWYKLAAEQGDAKAQYNLGVMYDVGEGVPQDDKEAVRWYTLAAEQEHAKAQYNLGVMYALGEGVIKDYVYAHMWGNIASMNENDKGETLRGYVAEKMTSSQIEEAQRLARECIKKNYKGC